MKAELEKEVTTIINVESKLIKEVKKAEDEVAKEQLLQQARIVAEKQRKDKAAAEVKQKLETIAATAPVQVRSFLGGGGTQWEKCRYKLSFFKNFDVRIFSTIVRSGESCSYIYEMIFLSARQVNSASEKAEADAVTNAVDKWVAQFEKLGL